MRRVVYGCDWCGAEAWEDVSGDGAPLPMMWRRTVDGVYCGSCDDARRLDHGDFARELRALRNG